MEKKAQPRLKRWSRPKRTKWNIVCIGLTDKCYSPSDRLVGYVGFHEYDGFIPKRIIEKKLDFLSEKLHIDIFCLKTAYGYHFVSFGLMKKRRRRKWASMMKKEFPSDFVQSDRRSRVLRISPKRYSPKPQMFGAFYPMTQRYPISTGHMLTYVNQKIIPIESANMLFSLNKGRETKVRFCEYIAKARHTRGDR